MKEAKRSSMLRQNPIIEIKQKIRDKNIIDLSIGDTDFLPPKSMKKSMMKAFDKGFTHYTAPRGIPKLRYAIAKKYGVSGSEVLVTAGGKEGIFDVFLSFVNAGEEVIFSNPTWYPYWAYCHLCSANPVLIETDMENNYVPSIEEIKEKITKKTKLLIINSPNNPTGTVYPKSFVKAVSELADDHNFILLSDEIYSNYDFYGEFNSARGLGKNVIVLDGFSKTFGMTGLRLCYLVGRDNILDVINKIHSYNAGNASSLVQYGAIDILDNKEYMVQNKEEMKSRSILAYDLLKDTLHLEMNMPRGAFYLFPRYDIRESSVDICKDLLSKKHVLVLPGSHFGVDNTFRIAFSQPKSILKEGIIKIKEYFEEI